jgi:dihydrofolate reductase
MRKLIARVFDYSVDGLTAEEGSEFFQFCRELPDDPAQVARTSEFYERADLHIMGRSLYEGMAEYFPTAVDHPYADLLSAARKVVFSRTLPAAEWANTTIARGDTAAEIDKLRQGGDGHVVVSGGISFWQSLMRLDLIDEYRVTLFPYLAGEGRRLFEGLDKSHQLELASSTAFSNGTMELEYRRHPGRGGS